MLLSFSGENPGLHAYLATLVTVGICDAMDNADGKRDTFLLKRI